MAEVSIKVCIRCRPFVNDGQLGVALHQRDDENGEVELLNTKYTLTRFGFTWAWWSAYGWKRHLTGPNGKGEASVDDVAAAENMKFVNQLDAYTACGTKVMDDLMTGNAVVLFAYGLSGSGKTFTVFGPDATDAPEAWFKHPTPHDLWGIFPRLAYEIFEKKQDGWKITMKYFQNVVDTVRDLMSPVAKEMNYKSGMRKDKDGFMDIGWCTSQVLESWDDLRSTFTSANARKAIAPTQFNPMSTRGHCIMTLEIEMPHPTQKGMKQKGRVYVCDLAGTEPAGDIVYAAYEKLKFDDGSFEYKYKGPHSDQGKTKELQDQGKKINLSLSEMAQFFMKMANAVKAKKLKAGMSIPGCNSYFLCKFLKDTMLQSRTYLFCAIRPEVEFSNYTFATLGFAVNASVVKLKPKKATTNQSAKEMELLEELEKMRKMVEDLKASGGGGGGGGGDGGIAVEEMNKLLEEKRVQLQQELQGKQEEERKAELEKQKKQYSSRGICLSIFENDPQYPHMINLDEDTFRNRRFLYMFQKELTVFGKTKGDIQPLNIHIVDDHCSFRKAEDGTITVIGGEGELFINGQRVEKGQEIVINHFDRVVVGQEVLLFIVPGVEASDDKPEPSARDAITEYHDAMQQKDAKFLEQKRQLEEEKQKLQEELERMKQQGIAQEEIDQKRRSMEMWRSIDETMMQTVPVLNEMSEKCRRVGRGMLQFKLSLQQPKDDKPSVKVQVTNTDSNTVVFLDPFEVTSNMNILSDQILALTSANVAAGESYTVDADQEIIRLLFDTSYQIGSSTNFLLHCSFLMGTEEDDRSLDVMKSVIPYNKIGNLDVNWVPLASPNAEDDTRPEEIVDPSALLGKSWSYRLEIGMLEHLPTLVSEAYVAYEFYGQKYFTETIQLQNAAREVDLSYSFIHTVDNVDQEFLDYLDEVELKFEIFIKPYIAINVPPLSTHDPKLCSSLGISNVDVVDLDPLAAKALYDENESLKTELDAMRAEKYEDAWKAREASLLEKIASLEAQVAGKSKLASKLDGAVEADKQVNSNSASEETKEEAASPEEAQAAA